MQKLKIAYSGSPLFSAILLERIINDKNLPVEIKLVITQPDMPVGRKQILTPTPVKLVAEKYRLPIIYSTEFKEFRISNNQLSMINNQSIKNKLKTNDHLKIDNSLASLELRRSGSKIEQLNIDHLDLCIVYAYGQILPKEILDLPKYGFWNIHPSLLPRYRGASPIAYPLILGDKKTGVSLMLMDEKMDHGPIIAQEELKIKPDDMRPNLEKKLTDLAFFMFRKLIMGQIKAQTSVSNDLGGVQSRRLVGTSTPTRVRNTVSSFIKATPQNNYQATYTKILKKSDGFIPLSILKKCLNNKPIEFTDLPKFLQDYINKYYYPPNSYLLTPNYLIFNLFRGLYPWPGLWTTVDLRGRQLRLKILGMELHDNQLTLTKIQLENKNPVDMATFNRAYPGIF